VNLTDPTKDFLQSLYEIEANARFVGIAAALRPRIGPALNWNNGENRDVLNLAQEFMAERDQQFDWIYGALLFRILAAFERLVRQVVEVSLNVLADGIAFESLTEGLRKRHVQLTGSALTSIFEPREHHKFDYDRLAENLASCAAGSKNYRLNANVFSAFIPGAAPSVLEKTFSLMDIESWWDELARDSSLQKSVHAKEVRETANLVRDRLSEVWRWRNSIAHDGEERVSIQREQFEDSLNFLRALGVSLSKTIQKRAFEKNKKLRKSGSGAR
jgi:hypothetical protein